MSPATRLRRWHSPSLGWLLVGSSAVVLAVPLLSLWALRVYDVYLLRQTERQLIAEAAVIAEAWRAAWLIENGRDPALALEIRPPALASQRYTPYEPQIEGDQEILAPQNIPPRPAIVSDTPERRAGATVEPLLRRAQVFNLSGVRVLDTQGCVVATTGEDADMCWDALPEVQRALQGEYTALGRRRITDEPMQSLPPFDDIRRRGDVRIFAAVPVFDHGQVIGVVRMSRTGMSALESLWRNRRGLIAVFVASLGAAILLSLLCARAIAVPLTLIARQAEAIVRGEKSAPFAVSRFSPAELVSLADALERMTVRLQERAAYAAEFAANVSHELKTPLCAVRGAAELLADEGMPPEQRARFIANIEADVLRLERLVNRLLTLARIDNAPTEPPPTLAVRPFFAALITRYGDKVALVQDDPPSSIAINPEHLSSAVGNLLDNAVRHGQGRPVQLRLAAEGPRLVVAVQDFGNGISPANQAKIFSRFFTTERDAGGTGLGLAIVKAIADARGGSVDFVTGPDGTTFTLKI